MSSLDGAVGYVRGRSPEAWTGQKRFKCADGYWILPLSEIQEDGFVFSEEFDISSEEMFRCCEELRSRCYLLPSFLIRSREASISKEHESTIMERLAIIRFEDYKILKERGAIPVDTAPPDRYDPFEDPSEPGPSVYGWTIDTYYAVFHELTEYQLIVPMRAHNEEYLYTEWDSYCTTFSNYDTDVDYIKYCDELSKKIKWIEAYLRLDYEAQVCGMHYLIGWKQALKIAVGLPHLPLELAKRGYNEYTKNLQYKLELEDYVHAAFEVWKRITKQKMCPRDALMEALADETFNYPSLVEHTLNGGRPYNLDFMDFIYQIPVVGDDEALEHIGDLVHRKAQRPKLYLDFVKLKREVALRTGMKEHGEGMHHPSVPSDQERS